MALNKRYTHYFDWESVTIRMNFCVVYLSRLVRPLFLACRAVVPTFWSV